MPNPSAPERNYNNSPVGKRIARISDNEHGLLTYLEQVFLLESKYPNRTTLVNVGFSDEVIDLALASEDFNIACEARGIPSFDPGKELPFGILSELQLTAANMMLDFRMAKTSAQKLKDLGLNSQTWQNWLANPTFQRYLRARSDKLLKENVHEVDVALLQRARNGDIKAIDYFNQFQGRFVPKTQIEVNVNVVISQVLDVISRRVIDAETRQLIAQDLLEIAQPGLTGPLAIENLNTTSAEMVSTGTLPPNPFVEPELTTPFARDPKPKTNIIEVNL